MRKDIEPFVTKLVQHARSKVIMPTHMRPPMSRFDPFWFVAPDTAQDDCLQEAMRTLLVETPDGYVIKDAKPGRLALITWQPE